MPASDLSVFFHPHGVAVIGASSDPEKLSHGIVRNLRSVHYEGPVYPVNPHDEEILDYKAYPNISEVPDPVELALIVVPAPAVAAQVEACGKRGVKCVIVISGGFSEMGKAEAGLGVTREREVKRIAEQYGIRLLGPNCMGTIDTHTPLNTTFMDCMPRPGDIAFVSQSGAMVAALIDWAAGSGVGFSRIVSLGNQADVTIAEMLSRGVLNEHTRVVTGYMEGVVDGRAFIEAAGRVARDLPVVFLKAGRGASAAKAVASHTGALAGDIFAYQAAFRRAGVLWANTMEDLVDWGRALAWQPLPKGNRVAILTNAGGLAILAADALEQAGMRLAPLTADTKAFLLARVFATASVDNPVDTLAGSGPATYALCLDALLADETVDAVVVIQAPQDWFKPASLAEVVGEAANSRLGRQKPVLTVIMGEAAGSEATQILHRRRIPNYAFPERVGSTLAAMWWRKQWLDANAENGLQSAESGESEKIPHSAFEIPHSEGWMSQDGVEALLAEYGISTPRGAFAKDVEGALTAAVEVGYPVALKLEAPGVTHKTDVGGVALDIRTPGQLRTEFEAMMQRVDGSGIKAQEVYVQRMAKGAAELIVGVTRDPQFGPLVMAGAGGTQVELKRDVAFELAPLSAKQAEDMLDRTAAGKLLAGFRGSPPSDRAAAVDMILRLSQIALDCPEVQEIEINPLIVMEQGEGAVAIDARVRLATVEP
jgi:acetyl coenzyme A synthetase (ADP forming)-like protein